MQSPRRFARKLASVLGLFDRSVRWILHYDLHCNPYKMAIVQELSEREGRAPHLMFHYLSSKVFLSSSLPSSDLMFHYLSSKVFLSFSPWVQHGLRSNITSFFQKAILHIYICYQLSWYSDINVWCLKKNIIWLMLIYFFSVKPLKTTSFH